jgi:hypothetical protein
VLPHSFHVWFNAKRGAQEHRFETFYRPNDRRTLRRLATRAGLRVTELELFEPKPAYLFFHRIAYPRASPTSVWWPDRTGSPVSDAA